MNAFRMYATPDGESHFGDFDVSYEAMNEWISRAAAMGATNITFNTAKAGMDYQWHNAPRRQFVIGLSGTYEVVVSDGETRQVAPGTVLLAEDLTGRGHIMRVPASNDVYYAAVPLEDQTPTA
ncbi:MAG: hypothetical protein JO247_12810 [Chloroflexi bacterium]|nr:hypothetical protein [Chloroflexota bacterium]